MTGFLVLLLLQSILVYDFYVGLFCSTRFNFCYDHHLDLWAYGQTMREFLSEYFSAIYITRFDGDLIKHFRKLHGQVAHDRS